MERVDNTAWDRNFVCAGKCVLGIFAKEPLPGKVKTRLTPPLSPAEAAEFYAACLAETVALARRTPFVPILFYSGAESYFRERFPGLPLAPQGEGDLGVRMERALGNLLGQGCLAAALVGTDTPDLPGGLIAEAFSSLSETELVTIPARDGGYVLIGESRHHPSIFRDIPWSTPAVLETTRARAAETGTPYREVGSWEDVDDAPSLTRLLERSPLCEASRFAAARLSGSLAAQRGG